MRVVVFCVAFVLASGAAWLIIDSPFAGEHDLRGPALENRVLGQLRRAGPDQADQAECKPRQGSSRSYLCQVVYGLRGSYADDLQTYVVTVDGEAVHARRRSP